MTLRMAHHTIEYYLKAALSLYLNLAELKDLRHNLESLYDAYSSRVSGLEIDRRIIAHINGFETLRYPFASKVACIAWGQPYEQLFSEVFAGVPAEAQETLACFCLEDFDKLVAALRRSLPDGESLPFAAVCGDAEKHLFEDNACFSKDGGETGN